MFGFIIANSERLSQEELARYKSVYCGLCRSLKERHGFFGRLALNYDMTFLVLLLGSLYEPAECGGCERCFVHPTKKHNYSSSEISDYAADMTVALSYLNQLDNWQDDRNILSLIYSKILKKKYDAVALKYPRQCEAMITCVQQLSELEKNNEESPDAGAKLFGGLMAELFVLNEDRWSPSLRKMGLSLGEFIYIMDAAVDLERDLKKKRYNPLAAMKRSGRDEEFFRELLTVLIGDSTMEFEKLPLVEDAALMRNILYSGVWTKYEIEMERRNRKKEKRRP